MFDITVLRHALVLAILPLPLAGLAPAHAGETTPLVELCRDYLALPKTDDVTADFVKLKSSCAGYINAHVKMSKPEDGFCIPKGYNMDDLAKVFAAWADKHPDRWKEPTKVTVTAALAEVYPCK